MADGTAGPITDDTATLRILADRAREAGDRIGEAGWRRRIAAAPDAGAEDRRLHAAALAAIGFADRAATIAPTPSPAKPAPARPAIDPAGVHIWFSAGHAGLDETDRDRLGRTLGTNDYSYGFALRGFVAGMTGIGMPWTILRDPVCIADIRTRSSAACNIHIGFYPPEQMRLLKGAYNVNCVAWEFDRLRSAGEVMSAHAFADQATMLRLPDMLWVPSTHGAAAIAAGVETPVRMVPSPVPARLRAGSEAGPPTPARVAAKARALDAVGWEPLAIVPRQQAEMDRTAGLHRRGLAGLLEAMAAPPVIFLTVLNVHDYRKQIRPMLQGFTEFAQSHPDALLLVKSSTPKRGVLPINSFLLAEQIFDIGEQPRPLVSSRVWITDEVLTRAEMDALYDLAGFYLCTSHAEGQNLPLLEAMGRGVVPVSVDHTAMADYIAADNAVPIRSVRRPFDKRLSRRYGMYGLETHFVGTADVREALARAVALTPADYAARARAAHTVVRDGYGTAPLLAAMRELVPVARAHQGLAGG